MNRREWLSRSAVAGPLGLSSVLSGDFGNRVSAAPPTSGKLAPIKITDVKTILTAPARIRLVVVKVSTSEPGLYGLGCATFTQRARVVETAVDKYLRPFLIGKNPLQIEDLWRSNFVSSYWRNGPVLGNAISGVDMALWDILGKRAGIPVYQLFGGKCRKAVATYRHASGQTFEDVEKAARELMDKGQRFVRVQVAVPGLETYGAARKGRKDDNAPTPTPGRKSGSRVPTCAPCLSSLSICVRSLATRSNCCTTCTNALPPILAIQLAKDLEPFKLFFLEDPLSPEDMGYFEKLRAQTSTPIAMGELFNNPNEWVGLVSRRLIDFIRIHISQVGGLTMARKVAALCEFFGVRSAWHGPGDVSPVGHAANVHLDLAIPNFGIQEARAFTQAEHDVFPGCPELKDGYYWANDKPGLGIDLDEKLAAKFPISDDPPFDYRWGNLRKKDGSVVKP